MIYQTSEVSLSERECVAILMDKFLSVVRGRIIQVSDVDQLLFQGVISYFQRKYKEDSYRQFTEGRAFSGEKTEGEGRVKRD